MFGLPVAFLTATVPVIGGFCVMCINNRYTSCIKAASIWASCCTLLLAIFLPCSFNFAAGRYIEEIHLSAHTKLTMVIDSFAAGFVPLICLVCLLCMLWMLNTNSTRIKIQFIMLFFFEALAVGAFYAADMFLLFTLMEGAAIPVYIIMASKERYSNDAVFQFLIYTMVSALLVLTSIIMIYLEAGTSSIYEIHKAGVKSGAALWLLLLGIAIKTPVWPFYHWLPVVHVKSQTVCSVILGAVTLKFGTLLIIRFIEPLFLSKLMVHNIGISCVAIASIVCASSQLLRQNDMKRIFAYFSIIHLNMYLPILFSSTGREHFIFAIIQHSILMMFMFFVADVVKKSCGTRLITELKSCTMLSVFPRRIIMTAFLILVAVPFSWNFVCEIISVYAASRISIAYTAVVLAGILVSSGYAIRVYHTCFNRKTLLTTPANQCSSYILSHTQKFVLLLLVGITTLFGIWPNLVLKVF